MDANTIEVAARWKLEDAYRDAELRHLIRAARPESGERPSWRRRPTLRRLRAMVHPAAAA
jgi:hypothetical protein